MQQKLLARLAPQLRTGLSDTLPQYMLPAAFVVLDALPRTTNGKIDRDALPPPPSGRPAWATGYVAPRDEEEHLIAEVWEQLLGVSPVGAEDNFFDLGGHSMLAVQVMSEIETRSGCSLPLAALFQDPTVENLARLLRNPDAETTGTTLVPLQSSGDGAPLYCIHPAGGAVFCYQALASHFAGERPVIGVQAHGVDGRQPPHETMDAMADAYAEAIRARQPDGPYHLCGWSLGGNIAYETARRLERAGRRGWAGRAVRRRRHPAGGFACKRRTCCRCWRRCFPRATTPRSKRSAAWRPRSRSTSLPSAPPRQAWSIRRK